MEILTEIQPIILAGGYGRRMGDEDLPKVMVKLRDKPMLQYLIESFRQTPFRPPVIVVGYQKEKIYAHFGPESYTYVPCTQLLGTGDAVKQCRSFCQGKAKTFLVAYGDHPLWTSMTMVKLATSHLQGGRVLTLATVQAPGSNPHFSHYGRILRAQDGKLQAIREQKDCSPAELLIEEYNPGLYCFEDSWLWEALEKIQPNNSKGEYYLTDLIAIAISEGKKVNSYLVEDWRETLGVNTPEQLRALELVQAQMLSV